MFPSFFLETLEVDASFTPPPKAPEAQQGLGTHSEGSLKAVLGDVASFLRSPEPVGDLSLAVSGGDTMPSAEAPFGVVEGGPGLRVLTPNDFVLRQRRQGPSLAASLLRSGEVERSLAQCPLDELEEQLVAASLQVSSIGYDLSGPVLGSELLILSFSFSCGAL